MDSANFEDENPLFRHKLEDLCIICLKELPMGGNPSISDPLPKVGIDITLLGALKILSNFDQLNVESERFLSCFACFFKTEMALRFHLMCNKSVENIKACINLDVKDPLRNVSINTQDGVPNIQDLEELNLIQDIKQDIDEDVDEDCEIDTAILPTKDLLHVVEPVMISMGEMQEARSRLNVEEEVVKSQDNVKLVVKSVSSTKDGQTVKVKKPKSRASMSRREACPHCHKFYRHDYMKIHVRIHTGEMPYQCQVCKKGFIAQSGLLTHMLVHNNKRDFLCTTCGKCFRLKWDLTKHQISHTDQKPHICEICGKGFRRPEEVKKHQVTHTEERPFACEKCPKRFTAMKFLRQHRVVHAEVKPILCTLCGKRFTQRHCLRSHLAKSCPGITPDVQSKD